jgi:hypothetical protein
MRIYVQLIESCLRQPIPTIILSIEKQRYMFNIPASMQRFIREHRQRFPKGPTIFFTRATTDALGGLGGYLLTTFENKLCEDTKLYVQDELYRYLEEVRHTMGFKILPFSYCNLATKQSRTGVRRIQKVFDLLERKDYPYIFSNSEKYLAENLEEEDKNEGKKLLNQDNEFYDGECRIISF